MTRANTHQHTTDNQVMRDWISRATAVLTLLLGVANFLDWLDGHGPYKLALAIASGLFALIAIASLLATRWRKAHLSRLLFYIIPPIMLPTALVLETPSVTVPVVLGLMTMMLFVPEFLDPDYIPLRRWLSLMLIVVSLAIVVRIGLRGLDFVDRAIELAPMLIVPGASLFFLHLLVTKIFERLHNSRRDIEDQNKQLLQTHMKLENASQAKSQFLANMSHELRTPLNAIIGYSEMLCEELEDNSNTQIQWHEDLTKINDAGKHLLTLISGILDLSKIEAGHMSLHIETFDIKTSIQKIQNTISPLIKKRNNTLTFKFEQTPQSIETDKLKMEQILLNLLSNATKFTESGTIDVRIYDVDAQTIGIDVTDSGIGIAPEVLDGVFEPFKQADQSTTRLYGGTGLGLALVRQMAQLMGGSATATSTVGQGSTFTFTLPIAPETKINDDKTG